MTSVLCSIAHLLWCHYSTVNNVLHVQRKSVDVYQGTFLMFRYHIFQYIRQFPTSKQCCIHCFGCFKSAMTCCLSEETVAGWPLTLFQFSRRFEIIHLVVFLNDHLLICLFRR